MKNKISKLLIGAALLSATACSDSSYDEKYTDPSKTSTVGVPQVFTAVLWKGNTWMNPVYYRYYTQSSTSGIFSGIVGSSNEKGRYKGAGEGYFNTRWKNFYDMLTQYRLLEYTYNNLNEDEKPANEVFYLLGRSVVESQLHEMLSLFGDVPFTGAGTLWNNTYEQAKEQCVYDDDVTLYRQILADLKEVGDYFASGDVNSTGLSSLARQDYTVAAGSATMWQKYVNSLRLRIALHLATNGDLASEAKSAIAEILNNPGKYPVIDNNDENMGVTADTQTDDFNYGKSLSQALHTGSYSVGSQTVLDAMNVPANGIPDANTDPRLAAMYDPNPDGEYIAYDVNLTSSQISEISDRKQQEYVSRGITQANYYCRLDSQAIQGRQSYQGNENTFGLWISAAEVSFIKAEAYLMGYGVGASEATAKANFLKGMQQSTDYYWGLKEGSSLYTAGNDSYNGYRELVKPSAEEMTAYFESVWAPTQEAICTQMWLNFNFTNELEAWNIVRRTGYPKVKFATDTQVSNYPTPPYRLPYPSDEINYNSANYEAAKAINYTEETGYYTNLFWGKSNYYTLIK
jgi:hypothetical protein